MFVLTLQGDNSPNILVRDSSMITKELLNSNDSIALMPSMDLLNNRELFISQKFGISFESPLSNSYIYFPSESEEIKEVLLKGDVASNEVILSKIVFNERYNIKIDIALDSASEINTKKTHHICGSENWNNKLYERGSGFAEQVLEITDKPYLNYVLASPNEGLLKEFNSKFDKLNSILLTNLDDYLTKINLDNNVTGFIKEEINSVNFDLTSEELEGLEETIQFIYFNQIIDNLFDINFV